MKTFQALIKGKIDQLLADPELTKVELMRKEVAFNWTVGSLISILLLTPLAYFLEAYILLYFGMVLILYYVIEIPMFRKHNYEKYQFVFLAAIILTAFVFMVLFGGYTNSAGLVFVGLTCVFSSILMKSVRGALILFLLYVFTILGLAVLDPYLQPHPDITPRINFIFFIINTIWMSAAMMFYIITYLTERNNFHVAETQKLRELDDAKNQLFTNITHEFRTPITLISGMADQIPPGGSETLDAVNQIKKQSKKLLNLVNQILDLAKIDSKTIKTHFIQGNIIDFLKYLFESFHSAADSKAIQFDTEIDIDELVMDYEPEKLEAILVNLVCNAIKFTPEGGIVTVGVKKDRGGLLKISVMDTGLGIPPDEIENIFDRFYQVKRDKYQKGNGIGLTIVKEFLNLMNGQIEVKSELNSGSAFKILLPITRIAAKEEVNFEDNNPSKKVVSNFENIEDSGELPLLLVIDDHKDITDYLHKLLKSKYELIEAKNGKEGFEIVVEHIPDIIISDVMMPEMDGFDFLKKIKAEFRTSHIPVLMLTAKADRLSKLEGLELGADAYLVKPFDKEELFIRLRKLLELRKILHRRFQGFEISHTDLNKSGNIEDQFMFKVQSVIDEHLDDESFTINELCRSVAMSHTQLYRKFSALTDVTINKFIRQYRLHKAMSLLKTTELNVTQIAMEVGFSNLAYFSRIFREEFDINPSEIRKASIPEKRNGE